MIYTPMTKKAMKLAYRAHEGETDKSGVPYIFHPIHVAEQMTDERSTAAALLHDTVEDSFVTLELLRREGFPEDVVEAVGLMTKKPGMPYLEYIRQLKKNPIAVCVKRADLEHNCDLTRLDEVGEDAMEHYRKYRAAIALLKEEPT